MLTASTRRRRKYGPRTILTGRRTIPVKVTKGKKKSVVRKRIGPRSVLTGKRGKRKTLSPTSKAIKGGMSLKGYLDEGRIAYLKGGNRIQQRAAVVKDILRDRDMELRMAKTKSEKDAISELYEKLILRAGEAVRRGETERAPISAAARSRAPIVRRRTPVGFNPFM